MRQGLATGAGLGLMAATWTGVALVGLDIVFQIVPWAYLALKISGAIYLLWLAWGMWHAADTPVAAGATRPGNAFFGGILVNLANPKSVLFASAVLIVIFPAGLTAWEKFAIVGNHFVVEFVVYAAFSAALSTPAARGAYLRAKGWLDRGAALILGALGLRLLFQR
ncbi:MAG: LysE family transporter [Pseudomonadota bacterium]